MCTSKVEHATTLACEGQPSTKTMSLPNVEPRFEKHLTF